MTNVADRRPGIDRIIEELRRTYPKLTESQLKVRAKVVWTDRHQLAIKLATKRIG